MMPSPCRYVAYAIPNCMTMAGKSGKLNMETNTALSPEQWRDIYTIMNKPRSANSVLQRSYYVLANPDLGLKGALLEGTGGGGETPQEQIAAAQMVINHMKETLLDPYLCSIEGGMMVVNWNMGFAWTYRNLKYEALLRLGTRIECPNSGYKAHALGAWSGLHHLNDEAWSEKVGVTGRTLRRWRLDDNGIWTMADMYLRIALKMAEDEFKEVGIIE